MTDNSFPDAQRVLEGAVRAQLALLDFSVAWWQTVLGQSVEFTELTTHMAERLQAGERLSGDSLRRLADFGMRNSSEFGRLALVYLNSVLQASMTPDGPQRRPGQSSR